MITPGGALGGVDAAAPDVTEIVAQWFDHPAVVGVRILRTLPSGDGSPGVAPLEVFDQAVQACEERGLPLFMSTAGDFDAPATIAKRHPGLTVIVDHLGLRPAADAAPDSPAVQVAARACWRSPIRRTSSRSCQGYRRSRGSRSRSPTSGPHLRRVVDAFGADRVMWGSDISRVYGRVGFHVRMTGAEEPYEGKHNYAEAVLFMRECEELSTRDRDLILGGTAQSAAALADMTALELAGKVAIVTGGASGIGEATVLRLAAEGAGVAVLDRDADGARRVADAVASAGRSAIVVAIDLGESGLIPGAVADVLAEFGRIDILVNNAVNPALTPPGTLLGLSEQTWDDVYAVNVKAPFLLMKLVGQQMVDRAKVGASSTSSPPARFALARDRRMEARRPPCGSSLGRPRRNSARTE